MLGIQFVDKSWEQIRGVPVGREGEFVYLLRPHTAKYPERLMCEVKVVENTKIITIRSTYKVENLTLYPLELMLVDDIGHPVSSLEKIAPGQDYSLPIDAVTQHRIRIQPDRMLFEALLFLLIEYSCLKRDSATNGAPQSVITIY